VRTATDTKRARLNRLIALFGLLGACQCRSSSVQKGTGGGTPDSGTGGVADAGATGGGGGAGGTGGTGAAQACGTAWPIWSGPGAVKPSLAGITGALLARQPVVQTEHWKRSKWGEGVALSRGKVVFTWAGGLYLTDASAAAPTQVFRAPNDRPLSAPTVDSEGRVYVSSYAEAYALDPQGGQRWSKPLPPPKDAGEFPEATLQVSPFVVSPEGNAYLASADRRVRAFGPDGTALWNVPIPGSAPVGQPAVSAGVGDVLLVNEQGSRAGLYAVKDGTRLNTRFQTDTGLDLGIIDDDWVVGYDWGFTFAWFPFDSCGRSRSPLGATGTVRRLPITTVSDLLVEMSWQADDRGSRTGDDTLYLWNRDGTRAGGPAPAPGLPVAAGADGTIYNLSCDDQGEAAAVQAVDRQLRPTWRVPLDGNCPAGNVVLTEDGVLWLLHRAKNGDGEIVAIQTGSPGLADSSWPSRRHDNTGASWLKARP
jgi:hypothetical protein